MSIASMTGFARDTGVFSKEGQEISWIWEIKSVNGKSLDLKTRLPVGFDDLALMLKPLAAEYLNRGSVGAYLELHQENSAKRVKIDEALLEELTLKAIALSEKYHGKLAPSSAAELLSQRGVVELEENDLSDDCKEVLRQSLVQSFKSACAALAVDRQKEGAKIKEVLQDILVKVTAIVAEIEKIAECLPEKLKEKLLNLVAQYAGEAGVSEERIAQEVVLLVTRADIREEIDRLKTHIKTAYALLDEQGAVGRRLDFLCQELNREANTTCSKAADIAITNLGTDLKALIEQFREQVQNIE